MGLRSMSRLAALLLTLGSALSFVGCAVDDQVCAPVNGRYQPLYTQISGTCGEIQSPNMVEFESGAPGLRMVTENRLDSDVTTIVVLKGCTVRVTQTVATKAGQLESQIDGDEIRVQNANVLEGQVSYVKYDPMSQPMCTGVYNATFSKNLVPLGAIQ